MQARYPLLPVINQLNTGRSRMIAGAHHRRQKKETQQAQIRATWGMCRQVLKSDGFRFAFLCSFFSYPILFNDPFEVSRHPDSDRG